VINGLCFWLLAAPTAAPSPVTDAVVYADGARVTRRARVDCAAGTTEVAFPSLPSAADVESLQAEAPGARVLAVRWERPSLADDPAPARSLGRVRAELEVVKRRLARGDGAKKRADGYGALVDSWAGRALWRGGPAAKWAAAAEAVLDEALVVAREHASAAARLRALGNEEAALVGEVAAVEARRAQPPVTAHVQLACHGSAAVALHYLVRGASWQPVHEIRAHDDGVEVTTYATVRQQTGEPWHDVRLSLSTARPGDEASPPALAPLLVWSAENETPKRIVAGSEEIARAPTAQVPESSPASPGAHHLATELAVPAPAQVPSDGVDVRVLVARTRQAVPLRLRTTPRLAAAVFRVAELVNTAPFPLLAGRLEIFRQGTFIGSQPLREEVPSGARFLVSFGVDDRVRIDRVILREVERSAGILGRAQQHQFAYRFTLASHLATSAEIELVDHLPVSQLDDVKVAVEPSTTAGYHLAPDDGLVTWQVRLSPGQEKSVALAFHVDVPSAYQ
jgi:uncharacterized protein (TIGR02231 family)